MCLGQSKVVEVFLKWVRNAGWLKCWIVFFLNAYMASPLRLSNRATSTCGCRRLDNVQESSSKIIDILWINWLNLGWDEKGCHWDQDQECNLTTDALMPRNERLGRVSQRKVHGPNFWFQTGHRRLTLSMGSCRRYLVDLAWLKCKQSFKLWNIFQHWVCACATPLVWRFAMPQLTSAMSSMALSFGWVVVHGIWATK